MQYVFFEKGIRSVQWVWGFSPAAGEVSIIFVLKVTLQSVRLLLTASCRKNGAAGYTSCSPNNFVGEQLLPRLLRLCNYVGVVYATSSSSSYIKKIAEYTCNCHVTQLWPINRAHRQSPSWPKTAGAGGPVAPGREGRWRVGEIFFWNFQVKMQGFVHFYCEKLLVARNREQGT